MKKVIYINSHPIQYYAPMFKMFEESGELDLEVWYCSKHGLGDEVDKEFGAKIKWDIPILEGYKHIFLKNFLFKANIYRFFGLFNLEVIPRLFKLPKSLIIVPGWKNFTYILVIFFGKLFGHKVALRCEGALNQELLKKKGIRRMRKFIIKNFLFKFIHYFLYIGKRNKAFYKHFQVPENRLFFTPYSVDNNRFFTQYEKFKNSKNELREKLDIPINHICFLFSGKYITKKRPLDLLNAYLKLEQKEKAFIIFMGGGELQSEMEVIIRQNNIKNVKLTGFINQSQVPEYYSASDVFIMCSQEGETWGLSTNEAMNFSLPLILSDMTGSSTDLVIEGKNGYTFPLGNQEKLAMLMDKLISLSEKKRVDMGSESLKLVDKYSYSKILQTLNTILN